jgi:uncharacterized LabA/DUF88 family protein
MVFIDGSNLYHSLKNTFQRTDIDIGKFCEKLLEKRRLVRIYYYNAMVGMKQEPERYRNQLAFFNSVKQIPYLEMRVGRLVYTNDWPHSPPYEKGIDIMLTTDLLTHSYRRNYDVAILVAGDTDYVGAIQAVKNNGQNMEVALFGNESTSRDLRDVADRIVDIDARFLRGCWKQINVPPQPQPLQNRTEQPVQSGQPGESIIRRVPRRLFPRRMPPRNTRSGTNLRPVNPPPSSEPPPEPPPSSLW